MARRKVDHLLIGGGLAAANCARWLREEGGDGSVLLVGREYDPPYNRPPLSKGYLQGKESREDVLFRPDEWWGEQDIELMTRTSVMKLDTGERVATLSTKDEIEFGNALIATGANVRRRARRRLRPGGHPLPARVRQLGRDPRRRRERRARRADRRQLHRLRGGGLADRGARGEVLDRDAGGGHARAPVRAARSARFFQGMLEEHGVEVHGGDELERFEGSDGRVRKVVTKNGLELDCDMVVVGVGVMPDVTLARSAGLELGETGGVKCSAGLESSVPGIYAAGDICEYESTIHGARLRLEHWDVAFNHGKTAALNMLGRGVEHDVMPYFFSDLADWASFEYVGPGLGRAGGARLARARASSPPSSCTRSTATWSRP